MFNQNVTLSSSLNILSLGFLFCELQVLEHIVLNTNTGGVWKKLLEYRWSPINLVIADVIRYGIVYWMVSPCVLNCHLPA